MGKAVVKLILNIQVSKVITVEDDEIVDEDSAHDFVVGSDDGEHFFTEDFDLAKKDWEVERCDLDECEVQEAPKGENDE